MLFTAVYVHISSVDPLGFFFLFVLFALFLPVALVTADALALLLVGCAGLLVLICFANPPVRITCF